MKELICDFIVKSFHIDKEEIQYNVPLISSGIIDSVQMLELVAFVEKEFGITVDLDDTSLENFDTIDKLVDFIKRKQK